MAPRKRSWDSLSPNYRRRLMAAHGGEGNRGQRRARARATWESGAGLSPEQRGHEPGEIRARRVSSGYFGPTAEMRIVPRPDRRVASRLGRYNSLVGKLSRGQITQAEFERRVRSWRPVAGKRLASDANAVLARLEQLRASDVELIHYVSGRAA